MVYKAIVVTGRDFFILPLVSASLTKNNYFIWRKKPACLISHKYIRLVQIIQQGFGWIPVYPAGQQRVHSSQRASGTAWWPPPLLASGGWTVSAEAWADGASAAQAGPRGCRADCRIGRGWWLSRESPDPGHSWLHHPKTGHSHRAFHPLPHCNKSQRIRDFLRTEHGN